MALGKMKLGQYKIITISYDQITIIYCSSEYEHINKSIGNLPM